MEKKTNMGPKLPYILPHIVSDTFLFQHSLSKEINFNKQAQFDPHSCCQRYTARVPSPPSSNIIINIFSIDNDISENETRSSPPRLKD